MEEDLSKCSVLRTMGRIYGPWILSNIASQRILPFGSCNSLSSAATKEQTKQSESEREEYWSYIVNDSARLSPPIEVTG